MSEKLPRLTREDFFDPPDDPGELRRRYIVLAWSYRRVVEEIHDLVAWIGEQGARGRIVTLGEKCQEPFADDYRRWVLPAPERAGTLVPEDKAPGILIARDAEAAFGLRR